tara:strand:- start:145 stop:1404 length:1260 start_codon:yes stop_codon:yes gene_type:complete
MSKNYYELLELNKNATSEEIKKSYKKLALKYHPDRNSDNKEENEKKFKDITEAYNVLSDEQKKKDYDYFGIEDNNSFQNSPFQNSPFDDILSNMFNFSDKDVEDMINNTDFENIKPKIFVNIQKVPLNTFTQNMQGNNDMLNNITNLMDDILFGNPNNLQNNMQNNIQNNPNNLQNKKANTKQEYDLLELKVDLNDIINSNKKVIKYKIKDVCSYCNGTCAVEPSDLIQCLYCKGNNMNCNSCNGTGNIFKTNRRCINCSEGLNERDTEINIAVPIGVPNNHIFIIKNKGSYNFKNKTYNHIKLKFIYNFKDASKDATDDINLKVKNNNIYIEADIKLSELFCGFKKNIKLAKNVLEISMDKYFDPSEPIIYKNMGIPIYKENEKKGDLIINFNIIYPKNDNKIINKYMDVFKKIFEKM